MPHYVNIASTDLHTGINGTVVVVGVKCLFALFFSMVQLFATAGMRMAMCCRALAKNNAKSMTVANGGNAIVDRRSVGVEWLGSGDSRIIFVRWYCRDFII